MKVPRKHSLPGSERKFLGTFVPRSESSRELSFLGAKVPTGNFRYEERKYRGAKSPDTNIGSGFLFRWVSIDISPDKVENSCWDVWNVGMPMQIRRYSNTEICMRFNLCQGMIVDKVIYCWFALNLFTLSIILGRTETHLPCVCPRDESINI